MEPLRGLTECLQTADKMHRPWKQAVTEFSQNYRATQQATTGATPFELLRNRKMRTKLHVLPVSHNIKTPSQVKETVKQKQQKSKFYTDRKVGAKVPRFQVNDTVRVQRPEHVTKGSSRFTEPLTVIKRVGPNTYLLSDGRKWNASKLAFFPKEALACTATDNETTIDGFMVPDDANHNAPEPGPRQSQRTRNSPRWLTGFVR